MAKLTEAKKTKSKVGDIKEIRLSELKDGASLTVRLVGEVHPAYRYWVTDKSGNYLPIIASGFSSFSEEWDNVDNDILYKNLGSSKPRLEFYYTINCIDRADGTVKILPLKTTIYNALIDLANNPNYGDPGDIEEGYDITITKEKTGPKPMNVKYNILPGRHNTPLTEEEKEMELYNLEELIRPKENYDEYVKEKVAETFYQKEEI